MIKILRSFLCGICFFIFGLGGIVIGSAVFPIILLVYKSEKQRKIFANTIYVSWRVFIWLICSLRLIKLNCPVQKQLKSVHGTIVIANHPSLIDVVILVSRIPNSICVVKESLFKNIFVRKVIGNTYLSNTMTPKEFIARGKDILSKGYNIVIFPEGTRTVPNKPIHLHRGFAHLQIETGADICPYTSQIRRLYWVKHKNGGILVKNRRFMILFLNLKFHIMEKKFKINVKWRWISQIAPKVCYFRYNILDFLYPFC